MYRLLIVEDEKWEREGLRDFINWNDWGIELIGCARDGVEGLELAERIKPEIIITDIMMPRMDGLRMSESIRTFLPDTKIIILSGYNDFRYAQKSICFRACSYILKPIEKSCLEGLLSDIRNDLNQKLTEEKTLKRLEDQWFEYIKVHRSRLLSNMLEHKTAIHQSQELGSFYDLKGEGMKSILIVYLPRSWDQSHSSESDNETIQTIRDIAEEMGINFLFGTPYEKVVLCLNLPSSFSNLKNEIEHLHEMITRMLNIGIVISVGETCDEISGLSLSYAQAMEAGRHRFLADYGEIIQYNDIQKDSSMEWETVKPQILYIKYLIDNIVFCIYKDDSSRTLLLTDELLLAIKKCRRLDKILIDSLISEIKKRISSYFTIYSGQESIFNSHLSNSESLSCTKKQITNIYENITNSIKEKNAAGNREIAEEVIRIIENKYYEELNLQSVSEELNLSPYYIGSIFKRFIGNSFNQYLQEYRIFKAEEILLTEKIKINNLNQKVGIHNQSYFSSLFKKKTGLRPGDYCDVILGGTDYV